MRVLDEWPRSVTLLSSKSHVSAQPGRGCFVLVAMKGLVLHICIRPVSRALVLLCNAALQEEATDLRSRPSAARPGEIAHGAALAGPTDCQSLLERSVSMAAALLPQLRVRPGSRSCDLDGMAWHRPAAPVSHHDRARAARGRHSASPIPASIPIKQGDAFASRLPIRPRASFSRKTIVPC
jgi:hypothetical protein